MKFIFRFFIVAFVLQLQSSEIHSQSQKINGISLVSSSKKLHNDEVAHIKAINTNYVAISPFGFIKDMNQPDVQYNLSWQWFGETNAGVEQYALELKKQGLGIMLKPQLWVGHGKYTGFIEMETEKDWLILEKSYAAFILNYAQLAEKLKIPLFCIGTEMKTFVEKKPDYWGKLIVKIRNVYSGKITYAANWDEVNHLTFWNQLDMIGIDAYFPLSNSKNPTLAELEKGWEHHKINIKKLAEKYQKPILFTEFGYRSVNYATKEPWSSTKIEGEVNLTLQSEALQSLFNQFWSEKWFAGGFVWKWHANQQESGGGNNNRYTPQNKPAEKLIKAVYLKYQ